MFVVWFPCIVYSWAKRIAIFTLTCFRNSVQNRGVELVFIYLVGWTHRSVLIWRKKKRLSVFVNWLLIKIDEKFNSIQSWINQNIVIFVHIIENKWFGGQCYTVLDGAIQLMLRVCVNHDTTKIAANWSWLCGTQHIFQMVTKQRQERYRFSIHAEKFRSERIFFA